MPTPVALLPIALVLLSACGLRFDHAPFSGYGKPGASREQRTADLRDCERALQNAGGSVGKSAFLQRSRIENCLERRGYSKQRQQP
jgi:hypothetical protein